MSEFGGTMQANMEFLQQANTGLLSPELLEAYAGRTAQFHRLVSKLNSRASGDEPVTKDNIKEILKLLVDKRNTLTDIYDKFVTLGSAMYLMGIHFKVASTLVSHPDEYAAKMDCKGGVDTKEFKKNPNIRTLRDLLHNISQSGATPKKKQVNNSLLAFSSSEADSGER